MTNITYCLLAIWQLETSCGKNLKHPSPNCHGHLGMSDAALADLRRVYGDAPTPEQLDDKYVALGAAMFFIGIYANENWTEEDILCFWRCGIKGMNNPTIEQRKYVHHGIRFINSIRIGDKKWRDVK